MVRPPLVGVNATTLRTKKLLSNQVDSCLVCKSLVFTCYFRYILDSISCSWMYVKSRVVLLLRKQMLLCGPAVTSLPPAITTLYLLENIKQDTKAVLPAHLLQPVASTLEVPLYTRAGRNTSVHSILLYRIGIRVILFISCQYIRQSGH